MTPITAARAPIGRRRVGAALAALAWLGIALATLTPARGGTPDFPFGCVFCGPDGGVDALANVLLFLPLGLGLGVRGTAARRALGIVVASTVLVEVLQLRLVTGRDTSLGDLVWNTAGGVLGYCATREFGALLRPAPRVAAALAVAWSVLWLIGTAATAWSVSPSYSQNPWVAHVGAPRFVAGRTADVRLARLGDRALRTGWLPSTAAARAALLAGAPLVAEAAVPDAPSAPVNVLIVDDGETEQMMAALQRSDDAAVFYFRTRAASLHLRSPTYRLPHVFASPDELVRLEAARVGNSVRIAAATPRGATRHVAEPGINWGWSLLLPPRLSRVDRMPAYTAIWLVAFLFPLAYWSAAAAGAGPGARAAAAGALLAPPVAFAVFPPLFAVAPVGPAEWAAWGGATAAGLGAAWAATRRRRTALALHAGARAGRVRRPG